VKKRFDACAENIYICRGVRRTTGEKRVLVAQQVRDPLYANPLMHGRAAKMLTFSDRIFIEPTIEE
jgi:hypothetical protein